MNRLAFAVAAAAAAAATTPAAAQFECPSWSIPAAGFDGPIRAMTVFDDGTGPALFVAGDFRRIGGVSMNRIAKWDGSAWTPLGTGVDQPIHALAVFDSGSGPALYAAGEFERAGTVAAARVARWDGRFWSTLGRGVDRTARSLAVFDDGGGPALFVGGDFLSADRRVALHIARFDGRNWSSLFDGLNDAVHAFATFDDGTGPKLYAGGAFTGAGPTVANRVVRWDGAAFLPVAFGCNNTVRTLFVFDDGSGPRLYAGGDFTMAGLAGTGRIARYDGTAWAGVGAGFSGTVNAVASFDDGRATALYAAGAFTSTIDSTPARRIARWDGARWSALNGGADADIHALASFDDGSGPALAVGGRFFSAGGLPTVSFALWRDPCSLALRGTVNAGAGAGSVSDVLFVSDSAGGSDRKATLATYEPFSLAVAAPPAAQGPMPFALFAWMGEPTLSTVRALPLGLGVTCFPTPLTGGEPSPRVIWNNTGRSVLGSSSRPSTPAPSIVASRPGGVGRPVTFTVQAIIGDPASAAARPASATNGVIVEVR